MQGRTASQPSLFYGGRSPVAAQSSYEAAVRAGESSAAMCDVLRRYMRTRGTVGVTDAEIERDLQWPPNVVTARRNDLVNSGEVVVAWPHCRRATVKPTKPGRKPLQITVWVLSEAIRTEAA